MWNLAEKDFSKDKGIYNQTKNTYSILAMLDILDCLIQHFLHQKAIKDTGNGQGW